MVAHISISLLFYQQLIFHCIDIAHITCGLLTLLTLMISASVNICVQAFHWTDIEFLHTRYLGVEFLGTFMSNF